MKSPSLLRILCLIAAALFLGCLDRERPVKVAGGDDYPNGFEKLGKKSAQAHGDSADWNGFDSLPKSGPGLYDTVPVPDSIPDTSKAGKAAPAPAPSLKRAAYAQGILPDTGLPVGGLPVDTALAGGATKEKVPPLDTLVTRVVDTATGAVEAVRIQVSDSGTRQVDSTVFVPADPARPGSVAGVTQVARRITYADSNRYDLLRFADADGDGYLSPRAGSANLAQVEATTALPGGLVETRTQLIAAGADLDFNARGDNELLSSQFLRTLGLDTVNLVRFLDADGDSVLIDFGKDSNLVDMIEELRFTSGGLMSSVTRRIRLVVDSRDSARNYPIRFAERRVFRDGAILDLAATGPGADSAFRPGQEAIWTETRFHAITDSLARSIKAYKVRLPQASGAFQGNVLLGFTVEQADRRSPGSFHFDFRCETPVSDRRWIRDGDVIAWLILDDGTRVVFNGAATTTGMRGQVTDSEGTSTAISFDPNGTITGRKSD